MSNNDKAVLLNIGYGNYIVRSRILGIVQATSAPKRRLKQIAEESGYLIDCTEGRKTRSLIITDSKHIFSSNLQSETIAVVRFNENNLSTENYE